MIFAMFSTAKKKKKERTALNNCNSLKFKNDSGFSFKVTKAFLVKFNVSFTYHNKKIVINPLTPNDHYSGRTAPPNS